ncbi:MAG: tRNA glutamyl-Q(34) synthetase GluQRS [Woeseiaceae bacterium]|nr:tRNA glutamyl-Q(34) synthetase GluQRS [Woeseiaceae bacterium]
MRATKPATYVGRFAPSPTGPLHFGSLLAATASYLDARANRGRWLVRIDDIDPPREQPGASELIVRALERYGFEWDGDVYFQHESAEAHRHALQQLERAGHVYPCGCSRRDLSDEPGGPLGTIYPGTCRDGTTATETALRVRTSDRTVVFDDALQGRQSMALESASGDFVIWRRDGLVAYQLAVVVDDALAGVTHIVRGIDLMDSTPRQIWLQQLLGVATPAYAHIPVAVGLDGSKLSKLTGALGLPDDGVPIVLVAALNALAQQPPASLERASVREIWDWAIAHWNPARLRNQRTVAAAAGSRETTDGRSDFA